MCMIVMQSFYDIEIFYDIESKAIWPAASWNVDKWKKKKRNAEQLVSVQWYNDMLRNIRAL